MLGKILTPFQKFDKVESLSGLLLFGATIIALIWANSPFGDAYTALWQYEFGIQSKDFKLVKPLILWINDGLMAIFFFLIGLEIKRELLIGELNTMRKASLPIFGAIGGMLFPVMLFFIFNNNSETLHGWGIPMATDIAFTLAILKLLGNRIPIGLKVFLTAFAIIDDIGAVLAIAIFYSGGVEWALIGYASLLLGVLLFLASKEIYAKYLIVIFGVVIWYLFLKAGIHPTVAGVLVAFAVPIRQRINLDNFIGKLEVMSDKLGNTPRDHKMILTEEQIDHIDDLQDFTDKVRSPLQYLEHKLHNIVAYFIMPVFALSNAGVAFGEGMNIEFNLIMAIGLSLFFGNTIGVSLMSFLAIKLKIADLPKNVGFKQIFGVAILAGVGFTMSLFIGSLAFAQAPEFMDSAKIGILGGSLLSGILGYTLLRFVSPLRPEPSETMEALDS